jgi:lysophospholipase L1-like esterase
MEREGTTETPMAVTDIRICFIGDSFVNGTGDPLCLGWTGRVCATAIQRGYPITYYNVGIRRETGAEIAARWRDECARRLPPTIDGRVVLSFGANDTTIEQGRQRVPLAATLQHLRAIVQDARRCYPTLLVGPPPVAEALHTARIAVLCHAMASVAQDLGVPYLLVCERLVQAQTWVQEAAQADGAHPQQGGYAALAALVQAWPAWWFAQAP